MDGALDFWSVTVAKLMLRLEEIHCCNEATEAPRGEISVHVPRTVPTPTQDKIWISLRTYMYPAYYEQS